MNARSSLRVGVAVLALGGTTLSLAGCNFSFGKSSSSSTSSSASGSGTSSSQPTTTQAPIDAKANACAVFNEVSNYLAVANNVFNNAANDPKRMEEWDKPTSDAADNASAILIYGADAIDQATTPQVPSDLAAKFKKFTPILRERAQLFNDHSGSDKMNPNGDKVMAAGKELEGLCPDKNAKPAPAAPASPAPTDPQQAKQNFCTVYNKEKINIVASAKRFAAATNGDANHPHPQWDDEDGWVGGSGADASIIEKYAADNIEAAIVPALPPDVTEKAKTLVAVVRKLSDQLNHEAAYDDIKATSANEYAPASTAVDSLCGTS